MNVFMVSIVAFFCIYILMYISETFLKERIMQAYQNDPVPVAKTATSGMLKKKTTGLLEKSKQLEKELGRQGCNTCVAKLFLECIGLSEEGFWRTREPILEEALRFYTDWYDVWYNGQNNDRVVKDCTDAVAAFNEKIVLL